MNTTPTLDAEKPTQVPHHTGRPTQAPHHTDKSAQAPDFASKSVPRHLARGAVGFGLIAGSLALIPVTGPVSLLMAPLALIAFRGCPTCWAVGLAQTISRGRLERRCDDGVCTLTAAGPRPAGASRG